jgi:hypothetical protein
MPKGTLKFSLTLDEYLEGNPAFKKRSIDLGGVWDGVDAGPQGKDWINAVYLDIAEVFKSHGIEVGKKKSQGSE